MNSRPLLSILSVLLFAIGAHAWAAPPAAVPYVWQNVAIGGGGYVTDVYCHPKQKDLVYIRTDVGGFFRWDAQASRWIPITDGFGRDQSNYYGGEGLALDSTDPKVVYIAAGKYEWASPGTIFKSGDQGRTWKKLPLDLKMGGNEDHRWGGQRLVVAPFHPATLLFGSRKDGLWRSADGGASWAKVTAFGGTTKNGVGITAIAFGTKTAGVVYAAAFGDGVYESGDDGLTWRKTAGGPAEVERLATAPDGALYATHAHGVGKYVAGQWADVTPAGLVNGVRKAFGGLSVNPRDPRDLLTTTQTDHLHLFRSRDGGATWAEKKTETRSSVPWYSAGMKQIQYVAGLTFDPCVPGRVWLSDWYATYRTEDISATPAVFTNHERGHEELVVFTLACPPGGPPLLSGTADVDGFAHDALDTFPAHGLGDYYGGKGPTFGYTEGLAWCATRPLHVARAGVIPWNNAGGGALSKDGGRTWAAFPSWDSHILAGRVAVSATDPDTLVVLRVGPGPALVTRDGGKSWQNVTGLPDGLISGVWNWQTPLAADGGQAGVFYVYHSGQVYRSVDGGASFAVSATGLPVGGQALVTVPGQANAVWLALGDGGLYRSSDGGLTFHALPAIKQASLLAVGKAAPGSKNATLYLVGALFAGRKGIFRSVDEGVSWDAIDDPRQPVGDDPNAMAASFDTFGLVFIGTNGRGIYYGKPAAN
jgi:xyloglucan-specific exo-beta-1,4-glucanase